MKNNIEVGIQRIYYVAWVVWFSTLVWAVLYTREFERAPLSFKLALPIGIGGIAPLVIMLTTRWIYRGFAPKQVSED